MAAKAYFVFGVVALGLLVLLIKGFAVPSAPGSMDTGVGLDNIDVRSGDSSQQLREMVEVTKLLIKQRNELIQHLNKKQQKLGQIACEVSIKIVVDFTSNFFKLLIHLWLKTLLLFISYKFVKGF